MKKEEKLTKRKENNVRGTSMVKYKDFPISFGYHKGINLFHFVGFSRCPVNIFLLMFLIIFGDY